MIILSTTSPARARKLWWPGDRLYLWISSVLPSFPFVFVPDHGISGHVTEKLNSAPASTKGWLGSLRPHVYNVYAKGWSWSSLGHLWTRPNFQWNDNDKKAVSLFFNAQSQLVYHIVLLMFGSNKLLNLVCLVNNWRFFVWLDRLYDMVGKSWMINVLINSNTATPSVLWEMKHHIDATRAEIDATRAQIDAIRAEAAALGRCIGKLAAQNAKLQVLVYFLFVISSSVASEVQKAKKTRAYDLWRYKLDNKNQLITELSSKHSHQMSVKHNTVKGYLG